MYFLNSIKKNQLTLDIYNHKKIQYNPIDYKTFMTGFLRIKKIH